MILIFFNFHTFFILLKNVYYSYIDHIVVSRRPESRRIAVPSGHDAERPTEGEEGDETDPAGGGCRRHPGRHQ